MESLLLLQIPLICREDGNGSVNFALAWFSIWGSVIILLRQREISRAMVFKSGSVIS